MSVAVEKYYSVPECALLLSCSVQTVRSRIKSGAFGAGVVNIGESDVAKGADYRVPASGLNEYLRLHRVFDFEDAGIAARCVGELRRKSRV